MPIRLLSFLLLIALLAMACREEPPVPTPPAVSSPTAEETGVASASPVAEEPESEAEPSATPPPAATLEPTRVPTGPLTVCLAAEPVSLYLYGPSSEAAALIREVVYDGPIDTRSYEAQPVILEDLPTLENGGAAIATVFVPEGQYVLDTDGNVVRLRSGITVHPAGCFDDSCAVTYERPESPEEEVAPTATPDVTPPPNATPPPAPRPTLPPNAGLEMNQLQATFRLLPGLTWSDGEPLTAADSVFSYEVAQHATLPPRLPTGQQGLLPPRSLDPLLRTAFYEATDELTVVWAGVPGYYDTHYSSNFFIPLPGHRLDGLSNEELLQADDSARLPLGWGPYMLAEWEPGERIVAERNLHYFRAGEAEPYFDQVIFRFVPGEPDSYLAELQSGGCDILAQDALQAGVEQYRALEEVGELIVSAAPGPIWEHLDFGINPVSGYTVRGDYFEDARVRRAAAYCLNREAIAAAAGMAGTTIPDAYIPPQHPLYDHAGLVQYDYDPEQGRALLAEAGAQQIAVSLRITPGAQQQAIAAQIVNDLAQCGFSVTVAETDPALFFATSEEGPIFGRGFDLATFAWYSNAEPACHLFMTREIPTNLSLWHGFNVTGYENPAYDAACLQGLAAAPGMEKYLAGHLEALRIFNAELPVVPLFQHLRLVVARPDISGLDVNATATSELWNIEGLRREE